MKQRSLFVGLIAMQIALVGCEELSGSLSLQLDRPSGFAIVDDNWLVVGQENGDTASFIQLDPDTGIAEEMMSPSFYLPLRWSIQPESRSWVGTSTRSALYVSGLTGEVEFIDFASVQAGMGKSSAATRSADFFAAPVGHLVLSPDECEAPCVARGWASLPSRGEVVEFSIQSEADVYTWELKRNIVVGGTPWELKIAPDAQTLFGTDLGSQTVFTLALGTEALQTHEVGSIVGPIEISTDGETLFVARPQLRDALLLSVDDLSTSKPISNLAAPGPSCIAPCSGTEANDEEALCSGLHPYNQQICVNSSEVLSSGDEYSALYTDLHTEHVVAVGTGANDPAWISTCDEASRVYTEVFVTLGIQAGMRFIGYREETGSYELINDSWCKTVRSGATTKVEVLTQALESPADILDDAEALDDVVSLLTVDVESDDTEEVSDSFEVLVARWAMGDHRLSVTWEGLADGQLQRPLGGGVLTADSSGEVLLVDDLGLNLKRFENVVELGDDLQCESDEACGDLLVITEGLTITDACISAVSAQDAEEAACLLERRIDSVVEKDGNTFWKLDREIPSACRPSSGRIGYEVRAARQFSVVSNRKPYRVGPGERFGFGTKTGSEEPIHVKFKDVTSDTPCAPPEGLTRGETGTVQLLDGNRVSQGSSWPSGIWSLSQSIDGFDFNFDLALPSDLKVWRNESLGTSIIMSLTGTNRLVYFRPVFEDGATVDNNPTGLFRTAEWYQDKSLFWLIQ